MFDKFIRQYVSNIMNGESDSSFAMAGKVLEQSDIRPSFKEEMSISEKVESLISQMTLEEKIEMLGGKDNLAVKGLPRLNIPDVWCTDASAGVRCYGRSTAFPVPVALTASWSRELNRKTGEAIGEECRAAGVSVLLGPGVNIYRVPTNGRNFEYMGEDPFLASELVVPYIQGVQSRDVITTVKHLACNNSDYDRHRMNSEVDERTLHEIYLPAFKAAVQAAKSKSVMCSYNPINGVYASENDYLLNDVLRKQWGFKGFVISDWTCVYSSIGPVKAGLDLEMPYGKYMNTKKLLPLLKKGKITEEDINQKIRNLMTSFFEIGAYDRPLKDEGYDEYNQAHSDISLQAAREAIVLLKNEEKILPLQADKLKKIALLGFNAEDTTTCGGGSCCVKSYDKINIIDGIKEAAGQNTEIHLLATDKFKPRITEDDKKIIQDADVVIYSAGYSKVEESECWERSWKLPFGQDALIKECSALNSRTIVVLSAGGGVETESWLPGVKGLLHSFYLGQNAGQAIAEVLFGITNPSGKLPFTMAKKWNDFETVKNYVKKPEKISALRIIGPQGSKAIRKPWTLKYNEKLMVGYRHFDTNKIEPQFPFAFGLSYTVFKLSGLAQTTEVLSPGEECQITLTVSNTGDTEGAEVVQLYIHDKESSLVRPEKELKGFEKVYLNAGESKNVSFTISEEHLQYYKDGKWLAEEGDFKILIGNSSRNIMLESRLKWKL